MSGAGFFNPRKRDIIDSANPNCKSCGGRGKRIIDRDGRPQAAKLCTCVNYRRICQNIQLTWRYMWDRVNHVGESELLDLAKKRQFLRITAKQEVLAAHLKYVMLSYCWDMDDPYWWVEVTNDKELVNAWLYTAKLTGDDIFDADVVLSEIGKDSARSVKDLATRADLMVIQIGKKIAANKETKTVFREALDYRIDRSLPVWIVDTPRDNLDNADVLAYSRQLMEDLADYDFWHVDLSEEEVTEKPRPGELPAVEDLEDMFEEETKQQRSSRASARSQGAKATASVEDLLNEEKAKENRKKSSKKKGGRR